MSESATIKPSVTITKDKINGLKETIRNLYMADDIPWVIGYSGGKDSTATLQLVWLSLMELPKEKLKKVVHIINTDTLVESPVIEKWVERSLKMMNDASSKIDASVGSLFVTHRLTPENEQTYWVNFIGRGYPFPRKKLRWCTDRLKIQPVNNFVKERIAETGEIILVLGTRKAESANRARTMAYYEAKRVRELLSPNPTLANELVFSPLEDWTNNDVWVFLMQYKNPWGLSNNELQTLYMSATEDRECPMMTEKNLPSCGQSRFGCWVCTMVAKDKSMEAMIVNDDEKAWMIPLLEFRNRFGDEDKDRNRRSFKKLKGYLQGSYEQLYHGPYLKEWREQWLREILEKQLEINKYGPEEFAEYELITLPELRCIRRIWVFEKHEFDDSLPRIYEEVIGKPFEDPEWIGSEVFGNNEWRILGEVCDSVMDNELYKKSVKATELAKKGDTAKIEELRDNTVFEMMASLINVENRAMGLGDRKDILDNLEICIKKNFYEDEADATKYYRNQLQRKRDMGGKYNEKFFINVKEEGEEFDDILEGAGE
ncbi:MAG: DNA phosphorothioation system sulfurtransferase DndC [Lachnospiraceae bacterium]|nr:DNA phosphorothioation system sulfurtransferase DndC [Lachnospiraceae bacterium]